MLLEARNVSMRFGAFTAVAAADLTVEAGEIIGLIGPNGAGKSTFFNCLTGDYVPSGGSITASAASRAAPRWGWRRNAPTMTFSSTVMSSKVAGT